jgi:3-methyl-2-oxobutanoate hydroxymethyltransferase
MIEPRVTVPVLKEMKSRGEKITALTAYDYPTARLLDEAGIDIALVGDSVGMVVLGFDSTLPVTMDMMIYHTAAVARAVKRALVVADMPFMSWHASTGDAIRNAGRFLQEAGAQAVKIEGGAPVVQTVRQITSLGIPVMGHLGMEEDARALEDAGIFALVLELVPDDLARRITEDLSIPTIGIGAGPHCDGQVQVVHDILGLYDKFVPKHAKQYARLWDEIREALRSYAADVRSGKFPERVVSTLRPEES